MATSEKDVLDAMRSARSREDARKAKQLANEWLADHKPSTAMRAELEMLNRLATLDL